MKPFFSVVIPTYNRAARLRLTLDSVIAQTFQEFEVLVMDDGSTDNTRAVVESFNDLRIRYEWADNSGGPATPRNRGIDASRGDWICFLDADDIWYPEKLTIVAGAIGDHPDSDVVCNNEFLSLAKHGKKSLLKYGPFEDNFYQAMLIHGNRLSTSATTVRRSFLVEHSLRFNQSQDYVIVEDYDLWLRIAFCGGRFHFINAPLGEYIIDDGNISSNVTKAQNNHKTLLRDHVFGLQTFQPDKDRLWRKLYAQLLISNSKNLILQNKLYAGVRVLMLALRTSFTDSVSYVISKSANGVADLIVGNQKK